MSSDDLFDVFFYGALTCVAVLLAWTLIDLGGWLK